MFASSLFPSTLLDVPRAYIDPIQSLVEALAVIALSIERPLHHSITGLILNSQNCGVGLIRTHSPLRQAVHHIISEVSHVCDAQSVVLASTRPRSTVEYVDGDDYVMASRLFSHAGITLTEWVVIGRGGIYCPRVTTDEPSRWESARRSTDC